MQQGTQAFRLLAFWDPPFIPAGEGWIQPRFLLFHSYSPWEHLATVVRGQGSSSLGGAATPSKAISMTFTALFNSGQHSHHRFPKQCTFQLQLAALGSADPPQEHFLGHCLTPALSPMCDRDRRTAHWSYSTLQSQLQHQEPTATHRAWPLNQHPSFQGTAHSAVPQNNVPVPSPAHRRRTGGPSLSSSGSPR